MKETGVSRRIDELGRIVIPKEIRKNLKLNTGDVLEIFIEDNKIYLKRFSTILGLQEDLFNIAKVINEMTNASIIFVDQDFIIVSYGKLSENYFDHIINNNLYHKLNTNGFTKLTNAYISNEFIENRICYITPLIHKNVYKGLMIVIENDKLINSNQLEIISHFKKFITKQLDR